MPIQSQSATTKKVRFENNEVTAVHSIERIDDSQVEELFYQPEEVSRFREEFYAFRAHQTIRDLNMDRLNTLVKQAREELQKQQEAAQGKMTTAPIVHVPFVARPTQRRNPLMSTQKGRAQMA